jgi:hypothetical protein
MYLWLQILGRVNKYRSHHTFSGRLEDIAFTPGHAGAGMTRRGVGRLARQYSLG